MNTDRTDDAFRTASAVRDLAPALPLEPDPAILQEIATRLREALASPDPVVFPDGTPEPLCVRLSVGRVLVQTEAGRVAVRPSGKCKACLGSTAYRLRVGKESQPCRCVRAQLVTESYRRPEIIGRPMPGA